MGRENQQTFHQRAQQHQNDHSGDVADQFPHDATAQKQGIEGRHRGQDCKNYRPPYFKGSDNSSFQRFEPFLLSPKNILTHDDGVIHHDTQNHDKGEQGDHIDGYVKGGQSHEPEHKGYGDSECNPKSQARIEKRSQE